MVGGRDDSGLESIITADGPEFTVGRYKAVVGRKDDPSAEPVRDCPGCSIFIGVRPGQGLQCRTTVTRAPDR